jgi:hypothetical protein
MRYEVTTSLKPQQALDRAITYFGPQGFGLEITTKDESCLVFQGGGGHVAVTVQPGDTAKTTLEIETREWDHAVRQFMAEIH